MTVTLSSPPASLARSTNRSAALRDGILEQRRSNLVIRDHARDLSEHSKMAIESHLGRT